MLHNLIDLVSVLLIITSSYAIGLEIRRLWWRASYRRLRRPAVFSLDYATTHLMERYGVSKQSAFDVLRSIRALRHAPESDE